MDVFEGYAPVSKGPYAGRARLQIGLTALHLVAPGVGVYRALAPVARHRGTALRCSVGAQLLWTGWVTLQILEVGVPRASSASWVCFFLFVGVVAYTRWHVRGVYGVWGSLLEDCWVSLAMYPFVLTQAELMVRSEGEGAPGYFDEVRRALKAHEQHAADRARVVGAKERVAAVAPDGEAVAADAPTADEVVTTAEAAHMTD